MLPLLELKKNLDSSILLDAVYLTDVGLTISQYVNCDYSRRLAGILGLSTFSNG